MDKNNKNEASISLPPLVDYRGEFRAGTFLSDKGWAFTRLYGDTLYNDPSPPDGEKG